MDALRKAAEAVVARKDAFSGAQYRSPGRVELLDAIEDLRRALASPSPQTHDEGDGT